MKKSILSIAVLFLFACLYGAHSEVKVYWKYRGDKRLIYEGSDMLNIGKKIRKGKPVITSKNSIDLGKLIGVVAKEIENEEEKKMIVINLSFKEKNMKKFISNKC